MKNKHWPRSMTGALMTATVLFSAASARAQGSTGNGGDAIRVDGRYCMLDLAEAGLCTTIDAAFESKLAQFEASVAEKKFRYSALNELLYRNESEFDALPFDSEVRRGLKFFISQLSSLDQATFRVSLAAHRWSMTDLPLINIGDENTFIDTQQFPLFQVAIRSKAAIQIAQPIFRQMSLANRIALIAHEVLYSIVKPIRLASGALAQSSRTARDMNGRWFEVFPKGKIAPYGIERFPPSLAWHREPGKTDCSFSTVAFAVWTPVGKIARFGGDFAAPVRYYAPVNIEFYSGVQPKEAPLKPVNRVKTLSPRMGVQNYARQEEYVFPSSEQFDQWQYGKFGSDICKSLIGRKSFVGTIVLNQAYSESQFVPLDDSGRTMLKISAQKTHRTSAHEARSDNSISSKVFRFHDQSSCVLQLRNAYEDLRAEALYYYEGISIR